MSTNDVRIGSFWGSVEAIPFEWRGSESLSTNDVTEGRETEATYPESARAEQRADGEG